MSVSLSVVIYAFWSIALGSWLNHTCKLQRMKASGCTFICGKQLNTVKCEEVLSRTLLLKCLCAWEELPGDLVKMQILTQKVWDGARALHFE